MSFLKNFNAFWFFITKKNEFLEVPLILMVMDMLSEMGENLADKDESMKVKATSYKQKD